LQLSETPVALVGYGLLHAVEKYDERLKSPCVGFGVVARVDDDEEGEDVSNGEDAESDIIMLTVSYFDRPKI